MELFDGVILTLETSLLLSHKVAETNSSLAQLLKRGKIVLQDHDWAKANDIYNKAIDQAPECWEAHLGLFLSKYHCNDLSQIDGSICDFNDINWKHALEFGGNEMAKQIAVVQSKWDQDSWLIASMLVKTLFFSLSSG